MGILTIGPTFQPNKKKKLCNRGYSAGVVYTGRDLTRVEDETRFKR